jgi:uncharacterized membrane protein YdjX (TVP38/TMEM64 family)
MKQAQAKTLHLNWKWVLALALIIGLVALARMSDLGELLRSALQWIHSLGPWAPVVFILAYILACVFFVPGSLLTLGGGFLFGVWRGLIYVSIGATLGATCAFLVGRYLARGWVSRQIEKNEKFKAMDEAVAREGWKIVLLIRLSPIFPFNLLNYAFGITRVSLGAYFLASWIGMLPPTVMYVYIGSLAGSFAALGSNAGRARTPLEWTFYGVGLLATVAVTLYVTRLAKSALSKTISRENK